MGNEQSTSQSSDAAPQDKNQSSSSRGQTKNTGIVVVSGKLDPSVTENYLDSYITRLHTCPSFKPILQSSTSADSKPAPGDFVADLDWKAALKVCTRIQDHLHACADSINSDQNSLATQIKQVETLASRIMQKYTERQKAFAKYAEHTKKIDDISGNLKRVRMNLDQTLHAVQQLNDMLPEEERLEPFKAL